MRLVVTGGTGFVGTHLIQQALASGHEVLSLSRRASPSAPRLHAIAAPIQSPPWERIAEFQPDALIHTAWEATPGIYLESPDNLHWVHWSETLIEGAIQRGIRRFVLLGTCIEYPITGHALAETLTPAPVSLYARCKDELHQRLTRRWAGSDITLLWARLFYPYGPGEHPSRLCSSLIRRLRAGERVILKTPHSVKDYIHIDDVSRALLTLASLGSSQVVNIGTGTGTSVLDLAQRIAGLLDRCDLIGCEKPPAPDPLHHVVADATRLRSLGWSPQVELEDGLQGLIRTLD
jgi:nucleoside-diphosphate-sugar epimerase